MNLKKILLKGITWGHSRGITPLFAASQRFNELYPDVEISWQKRSLQEFADYPIEKLSKKYDLLIIDHPSVGRASDTKCLLSLDKYLYKKYLDEQSKNSVGYSHLSYNYKGHQWALAIDAAAPVSSYREDLFKRNNLSVPSSWQEVIALTKKGKVAIPALPIDLLMNFYMFCIANGKEPFLNDGEVIDFETGLKALGSMRELYSLLDKKMFEYNPIAIAELMTLTDDYWYCPFAYGYSNYSRKGFAKSLLTYNDLPKFENGCLLRSTLGGAGLSISSFTKNKQWAINFSEWIASPEIQADFYMQNGGQPGHRLAWLSEKNNQNSNNYFINTLDVLDRAFVRPRYNGYLSFQDYAGIPLQKYLIEGTSPLVTLSEMNNLYRSSKMIKNKVN
jgi:multiple sugar transport system substrate-binding protein